MPWHPAIQPYGPVVAHGRYQCDGFLHTGSVSLDVMIFRQPAYLTSIPENGAGQMQLGAGLD